MVTVIFRDLLDAYEFVSSAAQYESNAFVNLDTGAVFCTSNAIELDDEPPEDLETSDRYLAIPHKNDLDLGRRLVMIFADDELPNEVRKVAEIFSRKGAYGRFKDLLKYQGKLECWYDYEAKETVAALRAWCEENGINLKDS